MSYEAKRRATYAKLKAKGAPCNLVKPVPGAEPVYDEETDTTSTPSTTHPGVCVISGYEAKVVDGKTILADDAKILCLFEDQSVPVANKDMIVVNPGTVFAETFKCVGGKPTKPDGETVILFTAQGRK
jgi:hypothetical protein